MGTNDSTIGDNLVDLTKLEKQTEKLDKLDDIVLKRHNSFIEYNVPQGTAIGFGLYSMPEIAVQRVFMSKGTYFPSHTHDERAYIIVYSGKLQMFKEDDDEKSCFLCASDEHILIDGEAAFINPGCKHHGEALEDTWALIVTIPKGEGFPDA